MIKIEELERRIDSSIKVPVDQYSVGLLNMVDFLIVELEKFLERENRLKGIVKIYLNNLNTAFQKIYVVHFPKNLHIYFYLYQYRHQIPIFYHLYNFQYIAHDSIN